MVAGVERAETKDGTNKAAVRQTARTARLMRQDLPSNWRRYFRISTWHKDYVIHAMNGSDQPDTVDGRSERAHSEPSRVMAFLEKSCAFRLY